MLTPGMSDDDEDIVGGRSVESVGKRVESKKVSWKTVEVVGGSPSTLKKGIDLKKGLYGDGAS